MKSIVIEPEFRDKIPPLSADEFAKLEENILADGEVREPLVLWNNTIIDGHHRWAIIQKHPEIPYKVKHMDFADKWAAVVWMCRNQLGRRNVTDEQKTVLIGEAYKAQKKTQGASDGFRGNQHAKVVSNQNDYLAKEKTKEIIAKQFGVGSSTVQRAEHFLDGLNEAEKVSPGIKEAVLAGEVKAPKNLIAEIRSMPAEEKKATVEAIKRNEKVSLKRNPAINMDLMSSVISGLKTADAPVSQELLADDFGKMLMRGIEDAYAWLEPRCAKLNGESRKKIIAALESAETAMIKMKGLLINE